MAVSQFGFLGPVSTTCGSGWVYSEIKINVNIAGSSSTHPLPQVVTDPV